MTTYLRYFIILFCLLGYSASAQIIGVIASSIRPGTTPVLDGIAFGEAEYSLRKVRSNGPIQKVVVRRSTDTDTLIIGSNANGDFDSTAFETFKGTGHVYALKLIDQSGQGNDATQTNPALQWEIVKFPEANNRYVFYSATGGYYTTANNLLVHLQKGEGTITAYCKPGLVADPNAGYGLVGTNGGATGNTGYDLFWDDRTSQTRNNAFISESTKGIGGQYVNQDISLNAVAPNVFHALGNVIDLTSSTAANRSRLYVDGVQLTQTNTKTATASTSTTSTYPLQIGALGNGVLPFVGYIAEIFIQNIQHTTGTVTKIQANQAAYY